MYKVKCDTSVEQMYKKDISNTKLLPISEQLELLEKAQMGDEKAKEDLIVCNLRFVLKNVITYSSCKHVKQCDLINEGVLGLIRAIESFDISKGVAFISYAVWWIKVYIQRAIIEKDNIIKLPETVILRIKKEIKKHSNDYGLPFDVYEHIKMKRMGASLDSVIIGKKHTGVNLTLADILEDKHCISPEHSIKDVYLKNTLANEFLSILPEIERHIIEHSFGLNGRRKFSMEIIAKKLNIGIVSLRNLKEQAINRIKLSDDFEFQQERYLDFLETEEE